MTEPRAVNCRAFQVDASGKVVGVALEVLTIPSAPYALANVTLIDEAAAMGNVVASTTILAADNTPVWERVWLAWPWQGTAAFSDRALAGNPQQEHPVMNGYTPPAVGPLAIYLGDAAGNPLSDICGGLGLPMNRHVCYKLTFRQRGDTPPVVPPEPPPGPLPPTADATLLGKLTEIGATLQALARHLGV